MRRSVVREKCRQEERRRAQRVGVLCQGKETRGAVVSTDKKRGSARRQEVKEAEYEAPVTLGSKRLSFSQRDWFCVVWVAEYIGGRKVIGVEEMVADRKASLDVPRILEEGGFELRNTLKASVSLERGSSGPDARREWGEGCDFKELGST